MQHQPLPNRNQRKVEKQKRKQRLGTRVRDANLVQRVVEPIFQRVFHLVIGREAQHEVDETRLHKLALAQRSATPEQRLVHPLHQEAAVVVVHRLGVDRAHVEGV